MKKSTLRGLTALTAFLLVVSIMGSGLAFQYAGTINATFGIVTSQVEEGGTGNDDTEYYKSEYGTLSDENLTKLIADAYQQCVNEAQEGSVLLKNDNNTLPLDASSRVTLFGHATVQPVYKPNSGAAPASGDFLVTYHDALANAGFAINETLFRAYEKSSTARAVGTVSPAYGVIEANLGEEPASFYTDSLKVSWENDYNDVAVIMIAREGGEDADLTMKDKEGISQLALHKDERDMLEMIRDCGKFKKVVVILNSPWAMETGWLDEYNIDACLWIGNPGLRGFEGVVNVLTGKANPSGRLTDTYAANSLSAPATVYSTDNVRQYVNVSDVTTYCSDDAGNVSYYTIYAEGIYVGYKYYETRYEDLILGRYGADSAVGSSTGSAWNYADEIVFPFGFGLSYTSFEQKLDRVTKDGSVYSVVVDVKNTGDVAGKSVVELYAQKPYGAYEIENKVESSAVQLVGFGKTGILQPGESEKITITVDEYLLASYDYTGAKGYILSEGTYYLAVGDDAHDAVNNILAAKGAEGMYDQQGNPVEGDAKKTFVITQKSLDTDTYRYSPYTGVEVMNQFEKADINYWIDEPFTYLSRSDWAGTFPKPYDLTASEEMIKAIDGHLYTTPENAPAVSSFTQGADNGLIIANMKDVDYDDDETWNLFLDQLTVDEMCSILSTDMTGSSPVEKVLMPALWDGDGIDGIKGNYRYGDKRSATAYTGKAVLASTWNYDLLKRRGELMGEEALYVGAVTIWCGGGDLDRVPFSGRNFEYYSEDGYMTYLMSAVEMKALQSKGAVASIKHYAGNDQEKNRESLATFFNEQSFRENNLRAFEGAFCLGGSLGTMQGFNRIGPTFMSQSSPLIKGVLRGEWGYKGKIITDAVCGAPYKAHFAEMLSAGVDYYCWDTIAFGGATPLIAGNELSKRIAEGDGYLLQCLREANKHIYYADSRSSAVNGISTNARIVHITPAWQTACIAGCIVLGLLTSCFALLYIRAEFMERKNRG